MITKCHLTSSQSQLQEYYNDNQINSYITTQNNNELFNTENQLQTQISTQTLNDNEMHYVLNEQNCACLQAQIFCETNVIKNIMRLTNQLEHAVAAASSKIKSIWNQQLLIIEQIVDDE
ncbi:Hypothetical_protein [Hexamita inflata]|uniref:Hypothetical_protein n=1 Tax=Hexamita inflata TaxID=28002 RepID=A0AA86N4N4_9EUKA|nr:Hypothetical protein HINF_LOCUS430 [Hexamita inflata]